MLPGNKLWQLGSTWRRDKVQRQSNIEQGGTRGLAARTYSGMGEAQQDTVKKLDETTMKRIQFTGFSILLLTTGAAGAQCAPGVPSAGNPGCIPPNQTNSPYYQPPADEPAQPELQPKAIWEDRWGAIAFDPAHSAAGAVEGRTSKRTASDDAIDLCKAHGGETCTVSLTYKNQCAAVAQGPNGGASGHASAATIDRAKVLAIEECSKVSSECAAIYSACSYAARVQ